MLDYFILYLIVLFGDGTIFTIAYKRMTGQYWWIKQKPSDSSISINANGIDLHLVGNPIEAIGKITENIFKRHDFNSRMNDAINIEEGKMLDELMQNPSFKQKIKDLAMRKIEYEIENMAKQPENEKDDKK